jgi:hypothetical protein
MEFPNMSGEDIEWLQDEFVSAIYKRIEETKEDRFMPKEERGKVNFCFCRNLILDATAQPYKFFKAIF